ncbi:MAG: twin-arginine translocation signal domain-containing protein [Chthonomonadales bacterium]|nr:twin-arginine translocation signal domain-containing protein [Chthonomonadales bacterium]
MLSAAKDADAGHNDSGRCAERDWVHHHIRREETMDDQTRAGAPERSDATALSRRQLLQSAAATGAALALSADMSLGMTQNPDPLTVGTGKRVITPDPLLPVSGGMGPTVPATRKLGDITARALYIRRGREAVGIVSLDLLGFPSVLGDRVRARVPRLAPDHILIGVTHTHSAPDCYAFPDGRGGHTGDLAYMERVCTLAAEAMNEAIDGAQAATVRIAPAEAQGKIAYNYYAPDLYDRRMSVIQARTPAGKPIATLVNYAIHPEVLGNDQGILSPDLCGPLYDRIEERGGGMGIFTNSAQGGMVTADNRILDKPKDALRGYWEDARTWEECVRIGALMADEALRIVADAPDQAEPALSCRSEMVTFPVGSPDLWLVVTLSPLKYPHGEDRTIKTRVSLVNLGDAQILTIPGEALPNIGFYLKRKMRGKHNMLFGLTNDAFGYILTPEDFDSFSRYDYVSRVSLGERTGQILIAKALEMVGPTG